MHPPATSTSAELAPVRSCNSRARPAHPPAPPPPLSWRLSGRATHARVQLTRQVALQEGHVSYNMAEVLRRRTIVYPASLSHYYFGSDRGLQFGHDRAPQGRGIREWHRGVVEEDAGLAVLVAL
eukprot:1814878-Pyramimonas_sp.AAC.1